MEMFVLKDVKGGWRRVEYDSSDMTNNDGIDSRRMKVKWVSGVIWWRLYLWDWPPTNPFILSYLGRPGPLAWGCGCVQARVCDCTSQSCWHVDSYHTFDMIKNAVTRVQGYCHKRALLLFVTCTFNFFLLTTNVASTLHHFPYLFRQIL